MTTAEELYTVEEFSDLPDPPDGGKMELVDGRVVVMSPVGRKHGKLAGELYSLLAAYVAEHQLGEAGVETGFRLFASRLVVRAPDVSFVETARLAGAEDDGFIDGPPTLAVEVISPDDRDADIDEKVLEYLSAGARRVWIVRPRTRTVTVHHPDGSARVHKVGETLTSDDAAFGVEGFELTLAELFA